MPIAKKTFVFVRDVRSQHEKGYAMSLAKAFFYTK